jgi:FkbH-like protein
MMSDDLDQLEIAARSHEVTDPQAGLAYARALSRSGDLAGARRWAVAATTHTDEFKHWNAAASIVRRTRSARPHSHEVRRVTVLGTYTTTQLVPLLELAGLHHGLELDVDEAPYDQLQQEILDPRSATWSSRPHVVVIAPHHGAAQLPDSSDQQTEVVRVERDRWCALWDAAQVNGEAIIVQHLFAIPPTRPAGHLTPGRPGDRARLLADLNFALAEAAVPKVAVVDADHLAAVVGKQRWFDPRYWFAAKQAVGLGALPLLARHTAAVIAARSGRARKCLVLDLDDTLWGGSVGEDGIDGLALGPDGGARGEAFAAFQEQLLGLQRRGILLAVASKNDEDLALTAIETHPAMKIRLVHLAAHEIGWRSKPESVARLAETLSLGLDSFVFVDDNPAERDAIRQAHPAVDVIPLPDDPAEYGLALDRYLGFEPAAMTDEDMQRTGQYRARAAASEIRTAAASLEEFLGSLDMVAEIGEIHHDHLPRVHQLVGKTNQFNLTTRRHSMEVLTSMIERSDVVALQARLRDRFTDHGLVSVVIGTIDGDVLDIDTWLMSCRVIGRELELAVLAYLAERAVELGCVALRGSYVPTDRNGLVADLFERCGFVPVDQPSEGATVWRFDLTSGRPMRTAHMSVRRLDS